MKKLIALVLSLMLLVAFSIGCKPAEAPKTEAPAPAATAPAEQGVQGEKGVQGEQGVQGVQGEQGEKGAPAPAQPEHK